MGTVVITGSASGIGAAVRARSEADGHHVIGVDLRGAEIEADLATEEGRQAAIAGVRAAAPSGVDRIVASAGLGPHLDDFALIASVNYFGAVRVLDGLLDELAGRPGAAAVAVCSNSAQLGDFQENPFVLALLEDDEPTARKIVAGTNGHNAYGGSKHALCRAVRRRARAWAAAGVRLNGICPGPTVTPLLRSSMDHPVYGKAIDALEVPLGRKAEPREMADVIAFLLGPEAAYVHGSILYVDGGTDAVIRPDRF